MLGSRLVRMIEKHSDDLADGLMLKLRNSDRTSEYRGIPQDELRRATQEIYRNLGDWLLTKTESDIELHYSRIGARRVEQRVSIAQFVWAILVAKEHLWAFLQREGMVETAPQLYSEIELLQLLDVFFDRAVYYAVVGYEHARQRKAA